MPIYRSTGTLTGTVNDVEAAQKYLTDDDMTKYLDEPLQSAIEDISWRLLADGHTYDVVAFTRRELTDEELKELASWTSGQNSDGLGEGFEQQDFAWLEDETEEEVCVECGGSGEREDGEECENCEGIGYFEPSSDGTMVSFDWKTNDSTFTRVK